MGSIKQNKFTDVLKNYKTVLETMKLRSGAADVGMSGLLTGRDAAKKKMDASQGEVDKNVGWASSAYGSDESKWKESTKRHVEALRHQVAEDKKAWEFQKQNVKDGIKAQNDWFEAKEKTAKIEKDINLLIKEQYEITQEALDNKMEGAKISTVSRTAETKNLRLDNSYQVQQNKLRQRKQELTSATLALTMATNEEMADLEWKAAADDAELQAKKNLAIETELTLRLKERVVWQKMLNELKEDEFMWAQGIAKSSKIHARNNRLAKADADEAQTSSLKFQHELLAISNQEFAIEIARAKVSAAYRTWERLTLVKGAKDGEAILKAWAKWASLNEGLKDTVEKQNSAYRQQLVILKDIAGMRTHGDEMNKARLTMGRDSMFGGDAFGALGDQFGGINPNAKKQREFLGSKGASSWNDFETKIHAAETMKWQDKQLQEYLVTPGADPNKKKTDFVANAQQMAEFAKSARDASNDWKRMTIESAQVGIELELAESIQGSMETAFQGMFTALIDGTKSFGDAMGDVMKQLLADLAAAYMKAAALKMLSAMGFGMPARYGGELTGPGYAAGGIASGPNAGYLATLHGREAVVPLGNDRSIPVDLKGASGNTVNVAVNISGGQSQTSVSGGGDMQALGRSIGGLVQQHLQVEMRPGGLLNRQGTTGRGG
jgi:hypothetical protein